MRKSNTWILIAAAAAALAVRVQAAQESDPVGYYRIVVPGNSDGILSVPISDQVTFQGSVNSIAGNVIGVSGTPFGAGDYTNGLYYVRFVSGANAGAWTTITNNTTSSLTVKSGDVADLSAVVAGDRFAIQPHATLASVFPDSDADISYVPSTSTSGLGRKTEFLEMDIAGQRANRSAAATYFYFSGFWRNTSSPTVNADDTVIPPQRYFILRNRNNTTSLTYGAVSSPYPWVLGAHSIAGTNKNDNVTASGRHGNLTLDELDLLGTGAFTPSATTSGLQRKDELFVFNNSAVGFNKSAFPGVYFCLTNNSWRSTAAVTVDVSHEPVIEAGAGLVIRRAVVATTTNNVWTSTPSN